MDRIPHIPRVGWVLVANEHDAAVVGVRNSLTPRQPTLPDDLERRQR
ncbi:hypothetical protein GA0070613_6277 [Micromonospora inositola]|uniref:Uncharacterized protein n=1 Tax=Micromonospora inositola TaxID=47865 RepID=A0A1C5K4H0_9ACTN|nr:hypothetical protein GA0070613_6277 [Micromonospora inositola]